MLSTSRGSNDDSTAPAAPAEQPAAQAEQDRRIRDPTRSDDSDADAEVPAPILSNNNNNDNDGIFDAVPEEHKPDIDMPPDFGEVKGESDDIMGQVVPTEPTVDA